jgi:hypothetical protein
VQSFVLLLSSSNGIKSNEAEVTCSNFFLLLYKRVKKEKKKRIHFFFWLECNSCSAYVNGFKNILYVKIKRKKTTMREGGSKSAPSFSLLPLLLPAPTLPLPYFFIVLCRSSPSPIVVDAC